jgi:PAS domain S-box-containing protein
MGRIRDLLGNVSIGTKITLLMAIVVAPLVGALLYGLGHISQQGDISGVMIGVFVLAFIVALGLGAVVTMSITGPLRTAAEIAERISSGERDISIPIGPSDETGQLLGAMDQMLKSVRETERKHERLSHRYELILQSAGEGIVMLDAEGAITYINPSGAEMLGWDADELVGCDYHNLVGCLAPDAVGGPVCPVQGDPEEAAMGGGEQVLRRRDGTEFPAFCTVAPLKEGDEIKGLVIVLNDITQRKSTQQQLKETVEELNRSNEELEKFAYAASHDLQEPLRKVRAFGDRLADHLGGELEEKGELYLERMLDATRRMQQLIDDLLTYSRITTRARPFVQVDLQKVAGNVISDLDVRIQELDGRVEVGDLPTVEAEPVQMRQLLQNLIGNGLKFHRKGVPPVVKVDGQIISRDGEDYCRMTVKDNGIGFKEEYEDRIFTIFQRLHPRGEYSGTGVGLALCEKIVQHHNGSITAHGAPEEGATFVVELPKKQND